MKNHLNLLPENTINQRLNVKAIFAWLALNLAIVTCLVAYGSSQSATFDWITSQIEARELDAQPVRSLQLAVGNKQRKLNDLKAAIIESQTRANHHPLLTLMTQLGRATACTDDKATLNSVELTPLNETQNPFNPRFQLTISGVALDTVSVELFTSNLEESGLFELVQLKSNRNGRLNQQVVRTFEVFCKY